MLALYGAECAGWTAKHFHEHLQHDDDKTWCCKTWCYTWVKSRLQDAHRYRRPRKPCVGMMLHQDGSRHAWLKGRELDLIVTLDDASGEIYSAFLVEEEGAASTFRALDEVFRERGVSREGSRLLALHRSRQPLRHHAEGGRSGRPLGVEHIEAYSPEARGRSERAFATLPDRLVPRPSDHGTGESGDPGDRGG